MLFLLFGSSGPGKTAALDGVRGLMPELDATPRARPDVEAGR